MVTAGQLFVSIIAAVLYNGAVCADIQVDGRLSETQWNDAEVVKDFLVTKPLSLAVPKYSTEAYLLTDAQGLYVGIKNEQANANLQKTRHARDADSLTDYNEVIIDFGGNGLTAYGFRLSAGNAIQDAVWSDETRKVIDWDGDWQYATFHEENHWYSEIFIPWMTVPMKQVGQEQRTIHLYIARRVQHLDQVYTFPAISDSQTNFVSAFYPFEIENVTVKNNQNELNIFPYIAIIDNQLSGQRQESAGMDLFWQPQKHQQLNLTLKPDFGQAENDELVVNFTAIESFFTERRSFFIENHALFDLRGPENLRLVHTPRIGSEPDTGESEASDILTALRYTQLGESLDAGVLVAAEDDSVGAQGRDYLAGRFRYHSEAYDIGYLLTVTQRPSLHRESTVQLIDYRFEINDILTLDSQFVSTLIQQNNNDSSDTGIWVELEHQSKEHWAQIITLLEYGADMDVSDFGFVQRVDRKQFGYETEYQLTNLSQSSTIRNVTWDVEFELASNKAGDRLPKQLDAGVEITWNNTSILGMSVENTSSGIDDLITRGNGIVGLPARRILEFEYFSDQRKHFRYGFEWVYGEEGLSESYSELIISMEYQISDNVDLSLEFSNADSDEWLIWLEDDQLATFKRQESGMELNLNAIISERHEIRLKMESVVLQATAIQGYTVSPETYLIDNLEPVDDFELSEFAMQLRYRYRIGTLSDLFVVYSRGGEFEQETLSANRSNLFRQSLDNPDNENLLFKLRLQY